MKGFFVTGTDTNVGKTYVTCELLRCFSEQGLAVVGIKPVASGCIDTIDGLRSEDALLLQQASNMPFAYHEINPYQFKLPISPNIAAERESKYLTTQALLNASKNILTSNADVVMVEAAGGWQTPLNKQETMADLAVQFAFPVILVVAIKLGCLNQALLTYESIRNKNLFCAGWVANWTDSARTVDADEIVEDLRRRLDSPLLGIVPFNEKWHSVEMSVLFK